MKKCAHLILFFIIPIYGYSHWEDFIDTTIVSKDSLVKIVNKGESEGAFLQRNILLKVYYKNRLQFKLENPKEACLQDTSDSYIGIEHLTSLPLIAACERLDSNHYLLLGYNLSDKKTGKFIWILKVQGDELIISNRIAMLSYRSPDQIDFFVDQKDSSLYFYNTTNKIIGDHVYIIGKVCKDTYKVSPIIDNKIITHYSFSGINNARYGYTERRPRKTYKIKFK